MLLAAYRLHNSVSTFYHSISPIIYTNVHLYRHVVTRSHFEPGPYLVDS